MPDTVTAPPQRKKAQAAVSPGAPRQRSTTIPAAQGRNIVLFSDGTGNSSAKVFKTNVWRMYEAVDLGPSPGDRDQISFYDDGVGTSNFKFLAALGGAFGWGLKRNVLDLYCYACRNYREGDQIYAFGFSRGAFTIRLVIALIASQGLVQSEDESDLDRKSREAYRAFRKNFQPRKFKKLTQTARQVRDHSSTYRREDNLDPVIRFVGVWDTVAAYGGPIAEITRAIDNWIYPLSMPDYELDEKVQCARHALAIDDERDAFQPLLWDELAEERRADEARAEQLFALEVVRGSRDKSQRGEYLREAARCAERKRHFRKRMQQVWFTGMHADVGGGYPDESLSYVSLLWMMEEAEKEGLRTLPSIKDRFFALANSYGPMHDSRAGVGAYYRYQPRKIAAWLDSDHKDDRCQYLMLRDPDLKDEDGNARGLLRCACVHESVIARINSGTVRYAPIALPRSFRIIPPQQKGEKVQQTEDGAKPKCKYERPPSEPLITAEIRERVERNAPRRYARQENLWDLVWWRRITYFATVSVTLLLVALPFWNPVPAVDQLCSDSRCVLPSLIRPLKALVPGFAEPWIEAIARYPVSASIYAVAIVMLLRWSGWLERRLSDRSYHLWRRLLGGAGIGSPRKTWLRKFREGSSYQSLFRWMKWSFLPAVFGLLMTLAILYVPLVGVTQALIQLNEANHYFCPPDDPKKLKSFTDRATFDFDTKHMCRRPSLKLEKGQEYEILFQLPVTKEGEPVGWWDAGIGSQPESLTRVRASSFFQVLGVPLRRVIEASYLQPLAQTSDADAGSKFSRVHITKLDLKQDEESPDVYRVRFRAAKDRETSLHLFANDAYLPFAGRWFYDNNCGTARVTIIKIRRGVKAEELMPNPGTPLEPADCAKDILETQKATNAEPQAF